MSFSTQYYGRRRLVINAISGVDLALWGLLGKLRQEPVRNEAQFDATGAGPTSPGLGFIGGKLPLHPGPTEVVPMFAPQLLGEPVPVNCRIKASARDRPGFGVELNPDVPLRRPYAH